jgi:hypothetical protein
VAVVVEEELKLVVEEELVGTWLEKIMLLMLRHILLQ